MRDEHPLLSNRGRDVVTGAILLGACAVMYVLVAVWTPHGWVQRVDDATLRVLRSHRTPVLTDVADVMNVLGSVVVTLPLRLLVTAYLAIRRRWWHLAAFVTAMVTSEILISIVKNLYDRPRPPGSLVSTSGASFPSGHAVATSVTAVAMVLALLPAGRHRYAWGAAAALFTTVMALSRAYLAAHWLSDALAGTFLGTTVALWSAMGVQWVRDAREHRHHEAEPEPSVPSPA